MPYQPWTTRTIGVEIEVLKTRTTGGDLMARGTLRQRLERSLPNVNPAGVGWYKSRGTTWDLKTDSSCGYEIASPALRINEQLGLDQVRLALAALRLTNACVNHRCGLHVHVNASDLDWPRLQQLVALWCRYEPTFFEIATPVGRRDNHFCPPLRMAWWQGAPNYRWRETQNWLARTTEPASDLDREILGRSALNIKNWWRTGIVEFRLHHGTLDYDKIRYWAALCAALVNRVSPDAYGMRAISTAIHQPRPELGFSADYVFGVLGLAPNSIVTENDIPPESRALLAFVKRRIKIFKETAITAPSGYLGYEEI